MPSACQPIADHVFTLKQQYEATAAQAAAATGAQAWTDLGQAGALLTQLTQAEADLDQCVKTHSAALTGTVVVIDASGGQAINAQSATLWDLAGPAPVATEVVPVQAGAFGFQQPLPAQAAITLQSTDGQANVTGPDFRSGPLPTPVPGQPPRLEVVVAPTTRIPVEALHRWASAFAPVAEELLPPPGGPLGPLQTTIDAVGITLGAGSLSVSASGSISGTILQTAFPPIPVSGSVSLSVTPSLSPQPGDLVFVALFGSNPVSVQTSSPILAAVSGMVAALLAGFIGELVRTELSNLLHQLLPPAVARGLALPALPPSATISLRTLTIDENGITYQPALGASGTTLSTYVPTPLPAP